MRFLHRNGVAARGTKRGRITSPAAAAAEIRRIKSDLSQISIRFNEVSLIVDTHRARKLSALALCAERASVPLAAIAADLERVRL
jgi:hypothetical protein